MVEVLEETAVPRPAHRVQAAVQRSLGLGALDHRLDDPVAPPQPAEIVLGVAHLDQPRRVRVHERRRLGVQHPRDRAGGQCVAIGAVARGKIQQQHGHAGIGHLRRDGCTHHTSADHADAGDAVLHQLRSAIVHAAR